MRVVPSVTCLLHHKLYAFPCQHFYQFFTKKIFLRTKFKYALVVLENQILKGNPNNELYSN